MKNTHAPSGRKMGNTAVARKNPIAEQIRTEAASIFAKIKRGQERRGVTFTST